MATKLETIEDNHERVGLQEDVFMDAEPDLNLVGGTLAGLIYHDLCHPLTSILAYSELLAENDLESSQRKDFHTEIRLAVCRMNDLISLLKESSRGPEAFRAEAIDIKEIVSGSIRAVAVRPEFSRIVITYKHQGLNEGRCDPGQLQRVITNVVLNACEAVSPVSGKIEVKSSGRRDRIEISIADNGPGIPQPVRHAVFQPFVSYGKTGGTGLGLAIVQKILRARGGEIYLERTSEKGTFFRVVLPYVSPHWS
jgi:signal transduction histidine kinase